MNKKILSVAVAAAMVAPMAAQAEIKMSGAIQAEIGSIDPGTNDRITLTTDSTGALQGGGPNKIRFDVSEDLGGGLKAFGRVDWAFDTTTSRSNGGLTDREQFVGLKSSSSAYLRMGRIQGAYKTAFTAIDPFYSTSGQARARSAGMSGGSGWSHSSFMNNIIEVGFGKSKGFSMALQGIADEAAGTDGSFLGNVKFSADNFSAYGAVSNKSMDGGDDTTNWKLGGQYKMGSLSVGMQYENAEMDTIDGGKGEYLMGSFAYGLGKITLAGWVAGYSADVDGGDALSYSLGAVYSFSANTMVYAAYNATDYDADAMGDFDAFAAGIRYSF